VLDGILDGVKLEEVREGIFSVLSEADRESDYDGKAGLYDVVVGNRFYNRLIWGNWPSNYRQFCRACLRAASRGNVIDAGCGSLVFTASVYAKSDNAAIVLLDRSIEMLEHGRTRLMKICGAVPEHITFVQGDIFRLPFRDACFDLVMLQGVLHMFDDKAAILAELERVKRESGTLAFTSLVGNNLLGRKYLSALEKSGEVATVHSTESLSGMLESLPFRYELASVGNMVYAKSA
jgi:ubiquinone/menaquinone biosynthesis C-methylase UbiE